MSTVIYVDFENKKRLGSHALDDNKARVLKSYTPQYDDLVGSIVRIIDYDYVFCIDHLCTRTYLAVDSFGLKYILFKDQVELLSEAH
jgi:hypothetical protein